MEYSIAIERSPCGSARAWSGPARRMATKAVRALVVMPTEVK